MEVDQRCTLFPDEEEIAMPFFEAIKFSFDSVAVRALHYTVKLYVHYDNN